MASDFQIRHAAHIIKNGGVIAYPTDTIYGLGCDPYNQSAVERINDIKQRPRNKHLILLASDINQLDGLLQLDAAKQKKLLGTTEPTSWIIEAAPGAPHWLTDMNNAVTVRITDNASVNKLCHALGHAIISTSANISGQRPAKTMLNLHRLFHFSVDKLLSADKPLTGKASMIIRLCDNYVIRP